MPSPTLTPSRPSPAAFYRVLHHAFASLKENARAAQESIPEAGSDGTGQVTEEATGKQELAVYFLPLNQVKETHALRTHAHAPSGRERN